MRFITVLCGEKVSFHVKVFLSKEVVYLKHRLTEGRCYNLTIFKCLALGLLPLKV